MGQSVISLRSQITQKVLNYFFINPDDGLYVNELASRLALDKRNLVKKLKNLEAEGFLKSRIRGNLKFYSINKAFPLYKEYKKIVLGSVGLEQRLRELIRSVPAVNPKISGELKKRSDNRILREEGTSVCS